MSYPIPEAQRAALAALAAAPPPATPQIRILDASAPDGGDGSWARPFNTFAAAWAAQPLITSDPMTWDYTVLVLPGDYDAGLDISIAGNVSFVALGRSRLISASPVAVHVTPTDWTPDASLSFSTFPTPNFIVGNDDLNHYTEPRPGWEGPGLFLFGPTMGDPMTATISLHGWKNETRGLGVGNLGTLQTVNFIVKDSTVATVEFQSEYGTAPQGALRFERSTLTSALNVTVIPGGVVDVLIDHSTIACDITSGNCPIYARNCSFLGPWDGVHTYHFYNAGAKFGDVHGCRFERILIDGNASGEIFGPFVDTTFENCNLNMHARTDGVTTWHIQNGIGNVFTGMFGFNTVTETMSVPGPT